jgi:DNA-binding CsgD family transcriptional regulator
VTDSAALHSSELERGREAFAQRAWRDACEALTQAHDLAPLEPADAWRLARAATLSGQAEAGYGALERLYHAELERDPVAAARAAFWIGFPLIHTAEASRGQGWLARAERCLERAPEPCVERGYLLLPQVRAHWSAGKMAEAAEVAERAAELGDRFADVDLSTFARNLRARMLVRQGELEAGLKLHDEAMLAATAGELSPLITGLVYCSAIDSCQSVFAIERVREWTESLHDWCESQPQLSSFTGACRVCRAEVMELSGQWLEALEEARRAERLVGQIGHQSGAEALYRQAEIHRLRGEPDAAEARYREAGENGRDPQPGLSLLRLAQGRADSAVPSLRRALAAASQPLARAKLLPALVDISLATNAVSEARVAVDELQTIAATFRSAAFAAVVARARGAVELAEGDAQAASASLRAAFGALQELGAPYLAAQARLLLACACQALGDDDTAALEIAAARAAFQRLGALTDVRSIDALLARASAAPVGGLSARELEVLRLVASGKTNKLIARELCLSEKTVDRHVSNVLAKLEVPTRAGATAFAYKNKLI